MRFFPGMSFLELLILIAIVGILSVIVVPELTEASLDVRQATVHAELENLRAKLCVYRKQHDGVYPSGENFVAQMTQRTDRAGRVMPVGANPKDYPNGPYLRGIPANPCAHVRVASCVEIGTSEPGGGNAGWHYNPETGHFTADTAGE